MSRPILLKANILSSQLLDPAEISREKQTASSLWRYECFLPALRKVVLCAQSKEKLHFHFEKDLCLFLASCTTTKCLKTRLKGQYCFCCRSSVTITQSLAFKRRNSTINISPWQPIRVRFRSYGIFPIWQFYTGACDTVNNQVT